MDIVKVLDFGISKVALTGSAFEHKMPLVQTMMPMGSPVYMSPEQIRASKDIDARTDIWSLGCVLYELLTGTAAFDAPSLTQLSATILESSAPPLRALCPNAPLELEAIILRCLEKDATRRFHDVGELAIALYPFAPRRARISAERCCYVLKSAGLSDAEFELPSVLPPVNVGAESEPNIPLAPSVMRLSPTAPAPRSAAARAAGTERRLALGVRRACGSPGCRSLRLLDPSQRRQRVGQRGNTRARPLRQLPRPRQPRPRRQRRSPSEMAQSHSQRAARLSERRAARQPARRRARPARPKEHRQPRHVLLRRREPNRRRPLPAVLHRAGATSSTSDSRSRPRRVTAYVRGERASIC